MIQPFQQGQLDGLCGIYSIINATKLINRLSEERGEELMEEAVLALERKGKPASKFIVDGITIADMAHILRTVICPQFNIVRSKPFHKQPDIPLTTFWQAMSDFLAAGESRSIITCLEWQEHGHWSVVRQVGEKRLLLYDSSERVFVNRSQCSTVELTSQTPVLLLPSVTYFLEKQ